jgi:serine/threonine protein kinase
MILGTPAYMPPEQVLGELDKIDARSDIYAMGVCLYEILTASFPLKEIRPPNYFIRSFMKIRFLLLV